MTKSVGMVVACIAALMAVLSATELELTNSGMQSTNKAVACLQNQAGGIECTVQAHAGYQESELFLRST